MTQHHSHLVVGSLLDHSSFTNYLINRRRLLLHNMITSFFKPKKKPTPNSTAKKRGREDDETSASSPEIDRHDNNDGGYDQCSLKKSKGNNTSNASASSLSSYDEATARFLASLTDESWRAELDDIFSKPSFAKLAKFVATEQANKIVYPPPSDIFSSLNLCPLDRVKVVIVGQDPYHGPGQAHGLCFSVKPGQPLPPSLRNIYRELQADKVGMITTPQHGHLVRWAQQGVLLLNTVWTVRKGEAHSHKNKGWEAVTARVLQALRKRKCVFLLWGKPATQLVQDHLPPQKHHVRICSSHPSPLGATKTKSPFIGSRCFSRCNTALKEMGYEPIDWNADGPLPNKSC